MLYIKLRDRIHRTRRFIKDDETGFADEHLGESHPMLLPFRELTGITVQDLSALFGCKPGHPERDDRLSHCQFFWKFKTDRIGKVVQHSPVGIKVILLVEEPDIGLRPAAVLNTGFCHIDPFIPDPDVHLAACGFKDPGYDPGEGRLARTALADYPEDLLLVDLERRRPLTALTTPRSIERYA